MAESQEPTAGQDGAIMPSNDPLQTKTAAERARVREIASYLSSACSSLDASLQMDGDDPQDPALNDDEVLQALVQLAAVRTNSSRSFLSLIDDKHQYIIAEATRTHSVTHNGKFRQEGDQLYLGVRKVHIEWGVCPRTIEVFTDNTGLCAINNDNIVSNKSCYIIRDFHADDHYRTRPYISGFPYLRSYAEVPLTTPLGYCIGSLCVVDNKLRQYDTDDTVNTLTDITPAIMRHLDLVKKTRNRARGEQLIEGLVSFMEGDSERLGEKMIEVDNTHAHPDSVNSGSAHTATRVQSPFAADTARAESIAAPGSPAQSQTSRRSSGSRAFEFIYDNPATRIARTIVKPNGVPSPARIASLTPDSSPGQSDDDADDYFVENPTSGASPDSTQQETPAPRPALGRPELRRHSSVSEDIRTGFARAANLIRGAMNLTGVSFLDACPSSFGASSSIHTPVEQDSEFDTDGLFGAKHNRGQPEAAAAAIARSISNPGRYAEAIRNNDTSFLTERQLQRMIKKWPKGSIFTADEYGMIDERFRPGKKVPSSLRTRGDRRSPERAIIEMLFRILKDARYLAFLPMWHFQKEQFFAAAFCWVSNPRQAFDANDLTYLSAFNNSLMAEVSRMEALAVSRAKSDFISSISHELRSPLHGILASAELLKEANNESDNQAMIAMIESCGRTLLDTMEHLLDFAKINRLSTNKNESKDGHAVGTSQVNPLANKVTDDVSILVQDVTEAVCIGHAAKNAFHNDIQSADAIAGQTSAHPVLIIVQIEQRASWVLDIQVGAWKRIVLNIFGNALKYTRAGTIEVTLKTTIEPDSDRTAVCFSVKDSGIGMSTDFQRYMLCQPFAQENILAPGTGLGLSIVKQIVGSLNGKLEIQSATGVGTEVRVYMPVDSAPERGSGITNNSDPDQKLQGKTLRILQPSEYPSHVQKTDELKEADVARIAAIESSFRIIAKDWLQMEVTTSGSADFYIIDKSVLGSENVAEALEPLGSGGGPTIIICYDPPQQVARLPAHTIRLWHPIAPKKVTKALLDSLNAVQCVQVATPGAPATSLLEHESASAMPPTTDTLLISKFTGNKSTRPASWNQGRTLSDLNIDIFANNTSVTSTPFKDAQPASPSPAASITNARSDKPHLLLVDDNPINLKLLSTLAKRLGCTYATAANGLEAVNNFKSAALTDRPNGADRTKSPAFDLIFMDISMPVMNGFRATREIRSFEGQQRLPASQIVALTGLGNDNDRREAFASGMQLFLTKPAKLAEVKKLLDGIGKANPSSNNTPLTPSPSPFLSGGSELDGGGGQALPPSSPTAARSLGKRSAAALADEMGQDPSDAPGSSPSEKWAARAAKRMKMRTGVGYI